MGSVLSALAPADNTRSKLLLPPFTCLVLQMQKKENLSREMKQRLRQEYYGLGGAENKVRALDEFSQPCCFTAFEC